MPEINANERYRWQKVHWWNDICGGYQLIDTQEGRRVAHVFKCDGLWRSLLDNFTTLEHAMRHAEKTRLGSELKRK